MPTPSTISASTVGEDTSARVIDTSILSLLRSKTRLTFVPTSPLILATTCKSYIFAPIHFSLITHHFFIIYLVILQMNEHIRLNAQKNVRGGVQNKQLQEINKP
jgi:Ca2+-dependent lipid-binding protein